MMRKTLAAFGFLLLSLFVVRGAQGGCPHRSSKLALSDTRDLPNSALYAANAFTLDRYETTRSIILDLVDEQPVIILNGDITLRIGNTDDVITNLVPVSYDNLKMVAHTAFAALLLLEPTVYLASENTTEYPLDDRDLFQTKSYYELLLDVQASLETCCSFEGDTLQRQKNIVDAVVSTLTKVVHTGVVSQVDVLQLGSTTVSWISENIKEATIINLNALHHQVMLWKGQLSQLQWNQLKVVVMSSHMPRNGELHMQYFSRLLETNITSGLRVIYAENVLTTDGAMELLGTHLTDFTAGAAFWRDPDHMHSDIQAQATAAYLPHLIPNKK